MPKKKRYSTNSYYPNGLPSPGESKNSKSEGKESGSHRALYTIESGSTEHDESSAVSDTQSESLQYSLDTGTIESLSFASRKNASSTDYEDVHSHTRGEVDIERGEGSSEEEDSFYCHQHQNHSNNDLCEETSGDEYDGDDTSTQISSLITDDDTYRNTRDDTATVDSIGTSETDTCLMSIDEHMARRHRKWFAMRFGRELKLQSDEEGGPDDMQTSRKSDLGLNDKSANDTDTYEDDDDEETSMDETETNRMSVSYDETDTLRSDAETLATQVDTLKSGVETLTLSSSKDSAMKSRASTQEDTAAMSETAKQSETTSKTSTCKSLTSSEGGSNEPRVEHDGSQPEVSCEVSGGQSTCKQVTSPRNVSDSNLAHSTKAVPSTKRKCKSSRCIAVAATVHQSRNDDPARDSTNKELTPDYSKRLQHVSHLSIVDIASTDRDISVVEPMKKRDAREAFTIRGLPKEVPATGFRDDISSIAPPIRIPYNGSIIHKERTRVLERSRSQDVEQGTRTNDTTSMIEKQMNNDMVTICCLKRRGTDLELFFIGLISISLVLLVILLIIIASKN